MSAPTGDRAASLGHLAGNRYFDRNLEIEAVKVLPGQYFVSSDDLLIVTMLGSCVAACIRDRDSGIGGLNHFMLAPAQAAAGGAGSAALFGSDAMESLIAHLLRVGARGERLEAKVFGGAITTQEAAGSAVGERNAAFVQEYLEGRGIAVVARDLLGSHPRKVYYFPRSGRVLVRKILRLRNDTLARREREYLQSIAGFPTSGTAGVGSAGVDRV
jgi:chemotaxis protein CheD